MLPVKIRTVKNHYISAFAAWAAWHKNGASLWGNPIKIADDHYLVHGVNVKTGNTFEVDFRAEHITVLRRRKKE